MYKENVAESLEASIPEPKGYKLLVAMPDLQEKTSGGVYLPDELKAREHTASIVGYVVSLGSDCYKDVEKFPSGAYCKEEDWVIFRSYSGVRFKVGYQEYRLINDDTVEAVVDDPRGYVRV